MRQSEFQQRCTSDWKNFQYSLVNMPTSQSMNYHARQFPTSSYSRVFAHDTKTITQIHLMIRTILNKPYRFRVELHRANYKTDLESDIIFCLSKYACDRVTCQFNSAIILMPWVTTHSQKTFKSSVKIDLEIAAKSSSAYKKRVFTGR